MLNLINNFMNQNMPIINMKIDHDIMRNDIILIPITSQSLMLDSNLLIPYAESNIHIYESTYSLQ